MESPAKIVIVGAGFGGLSAARALRKVKAEITVVDRRNHHLFQPLLYQVASAVLAAGDIAYPIRAVLRSRKNVRVLLAEAVRVDAEKKELVLADGKVSFDYLILASGASHSYFGHDEWAKDARGLKSLEDALEIRRRILLAFEKAEWERDPGRRRELLTFVVVGGGPTGVEVAGAIAEIACDTLIKDFRSIKPAESRVLLVEAGPRLLAAFAPELSARAQRLLERLGVEVRTGQAVTEVKTGSVELGDEEIAAGTIIWAAGVVASPLAGTIGAPVDRAGRVLVNPDLTVPGHACIFVIGDAASLKDEKGRALPGLAPVAIQQGSRAGENIARALAGRPLKPFHYRDKGTLATIGKAAAVAQIGKLQLSGWLAWVVWCFVHILYLIGFRNRFIVLFEWAWAYMTNQRGARLIYLPPEP